MNPLPYVAVYNLSLFQMQLSDHTNPSNASTAAADNEWYTAFRHGYNHGE